MMTYDTMIIAFGVTILNLIVTLSIIKYNSHSEIKQLKQSNLGVNINKVLKDFNNHIKIEYLKDRKIKISFPSFILDKELHFYIYDTLDGKIVLTDFGEMVKSLSMTKTPNKGGIKKVVGLVGVEFDAGEQSIRLICSPDKLDESLWTMFSALVVIEYVRY